jgi:hypothetical protein
MRESITVPSILLQHYTEMNGQLHAMTFFTSGERAWVGSRAKQDVFRKRNYFLALQGIDQHSSVIQLKPSPYTNYAI